MQLAGINFGPTSWKYDTGENLDGTAFITISTGTIQLKNDDDGDIMLLEYYGVGSGLGLGLGIKDVGLGLSASTPENWSMAITNVWAVGNFDSSSFPCEGLIISLGAAAPPPAEGSNLTEVLFGSIGPGGIIPLAPPMLSFSPFAGFYFMGESISSPSAGINASVVRFNLSPGQLVTSDSGMSSADAGVGLPVQDASLPPQQDATPTPPGGAPDGGTSDGGS